MPFKRQDTRGWLLTGDTSLSGWVVDMADRRPVSNWCTKNCMMFTTGVKTGFVLRLKNVVFWSKRNKILGETIYFTRSWRQQWNTRDFRNLVAYWQFNLCRHKPASCQKSVIITYEYTLQFHIYKKRIPIIIESQGSTIFTLFMHFLFLYHFKTNILQ